MKNTELKKALDTFAIFKDIFNTMKVNANFYCDVCDCFIIETDTRINDTLRYCEMLLHALNNFTNETFVLFSQITNESTHEFTIISVRDVARYYYPELENIALCDE